MVVHATLAAARVKSVAAGRPFVLCGDFNVKPFDPCYALLTKGGLPEDAADREPGQPPRAPDGYAFAAAVTPPLESAYVAATGSEPEFTNFASRRRVEIPRGPVAATPRPRRGYSVETSNAGCDVAVQPRPARGSGTPNR